MFLGGFITAGFLWALSSIVRPVARMARANFTSWRAAVAPVAVIVGATLLIGACATIVALSAVQH